MRLFTGLLALLLPAMGWNAAHAQDQYGAPPQDQQQMQDQQQGQQDQNAPDPPTRAARLSVVRGTVSLQPNGVQDWSAAQLNYPMSSGDRLFADQDGRVELQVGNSAVRMGAGTDLTLTELTDNFLQLGLAAGSIHVRTFGLNQGDSQEIDTPNGAIIVTQPGDVRVTSYQDQGTTVEVFAGAVQLTGPDLNQTVYAGTAVELSGANPIYVSQVDMPAPDQFDAWSDMRDRRLMDSVSAQYVSRQMPGYDDLDQYGDWQPDAPGYGPVWYPRAVPMGWTPYSTGYWAQVGPWGWTWVDTTGPWGYAPFHYGRWAFIEGRWGWVPGPVAVAPVYSPALVAFAGGGGFSIGLSFGGGVGLAAWFPLGPRDPYIPWYHCSPRYVTNVNITNVTIVNRTYVTNVVNNYNVNHTVINNYHFANVSHVVAVPANNFAGHPVQGSAVKLTPQQMQNLHPAVGVGQVPVHQPARTGAAFRPVGLQAAARPVAAPAARPSVITPQGMRAAEPGAQARPIPRGVANVNSTRPAPAPRQGAVTGNRPMPAAAPAQRPEVTRPEVTRPDVTRPDVTRPQSMQPQISRPNAPAAMPSQANRPAAEPRQPQPMPQQSPNRPQAPNRPPVERPTVERPTAPARPAPAAKPAPAPRPQKTPPPKKESDKDKR